MALLVILLGTNFNAEAQFGIINAIDKAAKRNKAKKEQAAQEQNVANLNAETQRGDLAGGFSVAIPKTQQQGEPVTFVLGTKKTELGTWNPTSLELTFYKGVAEESQVVYRIDSNTGAITSGDGSSKGSMSNDGTIVTPGKRTLTAKKKNANDIEVFENGQVIGKVYLANTSQGGCWASVDGTIMIQFNDRINPMVVAYITFGVLFDKTYTTDALDYLIEWNDQESINQILKYENSLPYAGFKDIAPELKNCKVAAIGLQDNTWRERSFRGNDGYTHWNYDLDYWVVYELTDGRNIVTFCTAIKESEYGDVVRKCKRPGFFFHEVTDWQRK